MIPTCFVNQTELENRIAKAIAKLGKEVVRVRYSLDTDWVGDPAIHFRVVLPEESTGEDVIGAAAQRVMSTFFEEVRFYEDSGLIPYFNFRSESSEAVHPDPRWS